MASRAVIRRLLLAAAHGPDAPACHAGWRRWPTAVAVCMAAPAPATDGGGYRALRRRADKARRGLDRCQESGRAGALPGGTLEAWGAGGRYAGCGAVAGEGTAGACADRSLGSGQKCMTYRPRSPRLPLAKRCCRMHGGSSTGPKTAEGLARIRKARTRSGLYSAEMLEMRRWLAALRKQRGPASSSCAQSVGNACSSIRRLRLQLPRHPPRPSEFGRAYARELQAGA
jgi:hypothetical protein